MPLLDKIREDKLIELAHARFDANLSKAELKVLHDSASSEDLPDPAPNAPRPVIGAEFLRWLASDPDAALQIDPKGLQVYAATIRGKLDLEGCPVRATLDFRRCTFLSEINLEQAETKGIYFLDSCLAQGISAVSANIQGLFVLHSIVARGGICLPRAQVSGDFACNGGKLETKGIALNAEGARIGGAFFLIDGFESEGEIRLRGAEITGDLVCTGAVLKATGDVLCADRATIGGAVFLNEGFESKGRVYFSAAKIGVDLEIVGATVAAVNCQNTVVQGDLIWQDIVNSASTDLDLTGARVKNLRDDRESWPAKGNLHLHGLVYEELTIQPRPLAKGIKESNSAEKQRLKDEDRIDWLMRQPGNEHPPQPVNELIEAQPWMLLSKHLEDKGDRDGAKHVVFKYRCQLAHAKKKNWRIERWWAIAFAWLEENRCASDIPLHSLCLWVGPSFGMRTEKDG